MWHLVVGTLTLGLRRIASRFYTRLHRYYLGSEDEFLRQVVCALDC